LTRRPGSGSYASYCFTSRSADAWKCAKSASVHQLLSRPLSSKRAPWSSKLWLISWPITAPIAP
jgi:hypothetical protein